METANPHRWKIIHIVNAGTFMSTLDVGIVNVSLPAMADQFGAPLSIVQWVVTSYLLILVAALPVLGLVSDKIGRHRVYSLGFLVFGVGSFMVAVSGGMAVMLASRCVQGFGAAMIMANSQAMVRQVFPDNERGRALGMNAVVISIGTLSGPALGGLLMGVTGWPALFWMNVPIGAAAVVLGMRWFPKSEAGGGKQRLDYGGALLLSVAVALLMMATTDTGFQSGSWGAAGPAVIGAFLLVLFLWYESRIDYGVLDRRLFAIRPIWTGNASAFIIHLAQMAGLLPLTFYMQQVLGFAPSQTGLYLALQPLAMGITAPLAGWYRDRRGALAPLLLGPALCAASMLWMVLPQTVSLTGIVLHLTLYGIGMGLFQATNNAEMMSAAPSSKVSLTGSLLALIRYLGMIGGVALVALLVGDMGGSVVSAEAVTPWVRLLFSVCFLLCLGAVAIGLLRRRPTPKLSDARTNHPSSKAT
ncbi:Riboflavin transporter RibZ [Paenibacillus allorhizosphaerae]|uniref:Riboflavin transporter RibZ n=2 Tax=Paenibacillus allorhizosphaerae TaxID=2849866 RepID=A0ABM8VJ14_9BACL|nr:Riboflavin transporter RibZ [Paenibacillus allorhizosphaerae]